MHTRKLLIILGLMLQSSLGFALQERTFCVWDPVGRNGPVMTFYSDVIPKAQAWGLRIRFEAYTEETDVVKHFKAGKCEAAVLTSILSRQFVQFAGTMDAIGAINSEKGLELAIATLTRERAGKMMREGEYEVVTTFPVGSMYAFVKDRSVDTIDEFKGKTLAILNDDPQMRKFADLAGAWQVDIKLSNFADKFNKGELDILIMPALAYNTFELYEGLGKKGGIIDYRLYYGMLQTIAKHELFPEDFGANMRSYMLTRMKAMNKMVKDAEREIPSHYWIKTNQFVKDDIDHFSQRVRLSLQDNNVNNPTALKLFWKIRCRLDPSRAECKKFPGKVAKRDKQLEEKKKQEKRLAIEKAKKEKQKKEQQRLAAEKKKQEALEKQRLAKEKQKREQERLALEKKKQEQQKLAQEQQRIEEEKLALEQERVKEELLAQEKKKLEEERLALQIERQALEEQKLALEKEKPSLWDILFGWI